MLAEAELKELALEKLEEIAPSTRKIAACIHGPSIYAKPRSYRGYDVMVICDRYSNGLRVQLGNLAGDEVRFTFVERDLIESDLKKGTLGDFLTEKLLYPYQPITNQPYFAALDLEAKGRILTEEVRDLILEYGEMSRGFVAKPEFFVLSKMRKRARAFLPSMDEYLRLLDPAVRERNVAIIRDSFRNAIVQTKSRVVEVEGDQVTIPDCVVDKWIKDRASEQVINIVTKSQRALYSYLAQGRAIHLNVDLIARELYNPIKMGLDTAFVGKEPEDPKNYLFLRTRQGLVSLNERASVEDAVAKLQPGRPITIAPLGGVLNEVLLVTAGNQSYVAKKFTDWHSFKWFTLNLVSFGSKLFALSGKTRMSNEYGINRYLAKKGLKVPEIVHVSVKDKLLIENYISGTTLDRFVNDVKGQNTLTETQYAIMRGLGETLARIHKVGVSVGDSKPENFVSVDGTIFTVDLEQAGKHGDYAWDVAELLFYMGHYNMSDVPTRALDELFEVFIQGYLREGDSAQLKKAAGLRYTRVFSLWTPAPVILEIIKKLREAS